MSATDGRSPYGHPQGKMDANGNWVRNVAPLKIPVDYSMTDGQVIYTVPAGSRLYIERTFWEVTTAFTGGTSSAIGLSSGQTGLSTKGDLLGGAGGDVEATLDAGVKGGTLGAGFGSNGVAVLEAGSTIRFDRIVDAFTAGAGFVHILGTLVD